MSASDIVAYAKLLHPVPIELHVEYTEAFNAAFEACLQGLLRPGRDTPTAAKYTHARAQFHITAKGIKHVR